METTVENEAGFEAVLVAHHRTINSYFELLGSQDAGLLEAMLRRISTGLLEHIRYEEEELFPELDRGSGMNGQGPTAAMCAEHRDFKRLLTLASRQLSEGDLPHYRDTMGQLADGLAEHNIKEERVLYPLSTRLIPAAQKSRLSARAVALFQKPA